MWRQVSPVIREQFLQLNEVRFIMLNEFVHPGLGYYPEGQGPDIKGKMVLG